MKQIVFPLRADNVAEVVAERDAKIEHLRAENDRIKGFVGSHDYIEITRLRAENEHLKAELEAEQRAGVQPLADAIRLLTVAVIPDGHVRCKIALEKLRVAIAADGKA